jgi:hypothetical protein
VQPQDAAACVPALPADVWIYIVDQVATDFFRACDRTPPQGGAKALKQGMMVCRSLQSLACVSAFHRDMLGCAHPVWGRLLRALGATVSGRDFGEALSRARRGDVTFKRALQITGDTGCELCGTGRIRKVYWEFQRRCCQSCLQENTVSDYRLEREFGLRRVDLLGLPFMRVEMYRPRMGEYTLRFFWKTEERLVRMLRRRWDVSDSVADKDVLYEASYTALVRRGEAEERHQHRFKPRSPEAIRARIRRLALQDPRVTEEFLAWLGTEGTTEVQMCPFCKKERQFDNRGILRHIYNQHTSFSFAPKCNQLIY